MKFLIILFLFSFQLQANVKGTLLLSSIPQATGEITSFQLELYPWKRSAQIKQELSKDLPIRIGPFITLFRIDQVSYSPNNPEVLVTKGSAVLTHHEFPSEIPWNYQNQEILIKTKAFQSEVTKIPKTPYYWPSKTPTQPRSIWWTILLFLVAAFFLYLLYKRQIKLRLLNKKRSEQKLFLLKLKSLEYRQELEKLYFSKDEWIHYVKHHSHYEHFQKLIEQHLYQKNWKPELVTELKKMLNDSVSESGGHSGI